MSSAGPVTVERRGPVLTLWLDRHPTRNALSLETMEALARAVETLGGAGEGGAGDDEVRCLVLRARGSAFCSGLDLAEVVVDAAAATAALVRVQRALLAAPVPVVAAVQGPVRAGGHGLVAAADLVLAARRATFAFTEARLGVAPAAVSVTVRHRTGARAAARAWLTGQVMSAEQAQAAGLVTTVVDDDALEDALAGVVDAVCANLPQGLRECKRLLVAPVLAELDAAAGDLASTSARLFASEPARSAVAEVLAPSRTGARTTTVTDPRPAPRPLEQR